MPRLGLQVRAHPERATVVSLCRRIQTLRAGGRRDRQATLDLWARLAYHNHNFELERWDGKTGREILFESAPNDTLQAELDTYWLQAAGASPATWLRKLKGRVPLVHLKDMTVVDGRAVQTEVGSGNLDWPEILSASREAGAEWLIVEQDESERDSLESLAISYRNLAQLL